MGTIKQNRANFITTAGKLDATGLNNDVPASNITNASMTNVTAFPPSLGTGIKQVSSDPPSPSTGQIWFNTTSNVLKQYILADGTWATGGNMNTARRRLPGAGIQTAALAISGTADPPLYAQVENYDGSSWTEVGDVNTQREEHAAAGTTAAALTFGGKSGSATANNELWNGSSWTEVGDLNTARQELTGDGTSTAAIAIAGVPQRAVAETWDGSSWTEVGDLNTGRGSFRGGTGTTSSALAYGGYTTTYVAVTESWNGSSWTEVADLNTTGGYGGHPIGSSNSSALATGGYTGSADTANTEDWDGSSWTEVGDLPSATANNGGAGNATTGITFGGRNPSVTNATYEWNRSLAVQTITTS